MHIAQDNFYVSFPLIQTYQRPSLASASSTKIRPHIESPSEQQHPLQYDANHFPFIPIFLRLFDKKNAAQTFEVGYDGLLRMNL